MKTHIIYTQYILHVRHLAAGVSIEAQRRHGKGRSSRFFFELCRSLRTRVPVSTAVSIHEICAMLFRQMSALTRYDGVWSLDARSLAICARTCYWPLVIPPLLVARHKVTSAAAIADRTYIPVHKLGWQCYHCWGGTPHSVPQQSVPTWLVSINITINK